MEIRNEFIDHWGALGTAWGINRSMAQIHGYLMIASDPVSTDELMDELDISRGNASTNVRELIDWGLVRAVVKRGDRRQYFEAEKDPWRIFCMVARERKRREIEPTRRMLEDLQTKTAGLRTAEGKAMHDQVSALASFAALASDFLDKVASREESQIVPKVLKLFS